MIVVLTIGIKSAQWRSSGNILRKISFQEIAFASCACVLNGRAIKHENSFLLQRVRALLTPIMATIRVKLPHYDDVGRTINDKRWTDNRIPLDESLQDDRALTVVIPRFLAGPRAESGFRPGLRNPAARRFLMVIVNFE